MYGLENHFNWNKQFHWYNQTYVQVWQFLLDYISTCALFGFLIPCPGLNYFINTFNQHLTLAAPQSRTQVHETKFPRKALSLSNAYASMYGESLLLDDIRIHDNNKKLSSIPAYKFDPEQSLDRIKFFTAEYHYQILVTVYLIITKLRQEHNYTVRCAPLLKMSLDKDSVWHPVFQKNQKC